MRGECSDGNGSCISLSDRIEIPFYTGWKFVPPACGNTNMLTYLDTEFDELAMSVLFIISQFFVFFGFVSFSFLNFSLLDLLVENRNTISFPLCGMCGIV
jgi:hypothetical protein